MTMYKKKIGSLAIAMAACAALVTACAAPPVQPVTKRNSELTHGNVQLKIEKGRTNQAEILDAFGAPNITTTDASGQEVWTYQRAATVEQDSANYSFWTVILAGGGSESSGFEQSSSMTTLIIKFDDNDVVSDFRSRSSTF